MFVFTDRLLRLTIRVEVEIAASPARVWQVLTDFGAYPAWNPLIRELAAIDETSRSTEPRLRARVRAPGRRAVTFYPWVVLWAPERELRLRTHFGSARLLAADHRFVIEPLARGGSRFIQTEAFSGALTPLLRRLICVDTRRGIEAMNLGLKWRVEGAGEIVREAVPCAPLHSGTTPYPRAR